MDNTRKKKIGKNIQFDRESAFEAVVGKSMAESVMLDIKAYKIIE